MDRKLLPVVAAGAVALLSAGSLVQEALRESQDMVSLYEQRFAPLRAELSGTAAVGYLTDLPPNDISAHTELRLLQYAVAPVIVVKGAEQPLVIGNFHTASGVTASTRDKGLMLVKDLGNGVMLYRR